MTLTRKFILWVAVLIGGVLLLGGLSVWNLVTLLHSANAAAAEYTAMDRADAAINELTWLRDAYRGPYAAAYRGDAFFAGLRRGVTAAITELESAADLEDGDAAEELKQATAAAANIESAARTVAGDASRTALTAASADLDSARKALLSVSNSVPTSARRHVTGAADRLQSRLLWTCVWLVVVLVVSAGVHAAQYRALVKPLLWLRDDMLASRSAGYLERVRARGDKEFADVAALFNGLARDLADLYRGMEEKVIARSRELVRSERLASVGFLAAGVAHEINNPLSVISGYAEMTARGLERLLLGDAAVDRPDDAAEAEAESLTNAFDAQQLIRDEAFRCKEITGRLLNLARGGTGLREPLRLDELAKQVATLTRGLRDYRDRRVILEFGDSGPLDVLANAVELKQVVMNLTVNALEATPAATGEVRIGGRRDGERAEIWVRDNGRGMSAQTLQQVFEPFFTAKRGAGEPGTGLGLSITHAIVENHGGRIRAESDGPGRGSRFVVTFPVATPTVVP